MSEIAKKSVENFAARIIGQAFGVAGAIVIARTLGPSGKGVFTYAATVVAMFQMINAGQSSAIAWQYTRRKRRASDLLRAMGSVQVVFVLPVIAGLIAAAIFLPGQQALLAAAAAVPFALFVQSSTGFFLADGDVRAVNVQQILMGVLSAAAYMPLLIVLHANLAVLFAVWVAGFVAAAVYTAFKLRRYAQITEGDAANGLVREQLGYAGQVSLNSAVQYLNFRIDVFIIMALLGQSALGVYSIGIGLGEVLWQVSRPMVTASFARIARGSESEAAAATATCMRHSFALVLLGAIVIFFAAPPLIPLVYGRQFAEAGLVARLLLPGIIAYSMMPTLATFFAQQLGQPRIPLIFSSVSTVLCAVITFLTIPHFGILGGAMATSASYCVAFTAAATYFVRRTRIAPRWLFALTRADLEPYRSLIARTAGSLRG
jgi:O-antigen/teichoic acid export membrane protein